MKHERNVDGLRRNAQKKKEEAVKRTDKAIQQLLYEARPINFKTVSEVAGVSTAWLYKEEQIKQRIESLREHGIKKQKLVASKQQAIDVFEEPKYLDLKKKFQEIEAENRELRGQLEVSYSRQEVLTEENEAKQSKIEHLTKLLSETQAEISELRKA